MTKAEILDDLEYVKSMAEEGRSTPLLGGRIGLMWGVLLVIAFTGHWAIISGTAGLAQSTLGYLWLSFAIVGSGGCAVLASAINKKPGASSVGNRTENVIWTTISLMIGACFLGIVANLLLNKGTPHLFDIMVCIGFAGQIVAYLTVSAMSGDKSLRIPGILAVFATIGSFALYGKPELYLAAAIGIVFTVILPSLSQIRKEPHAIV